MAVLYAKLEMHTTGLLFQYATDSGEKEVVKILLDQRGVDVNALSGRTEIVTALHAAVKTREVEICKHLLDHGADVNVEAIGGFPGTALHIAAIWGANAKMLLNHGANIHVRDRLGRTPLHLAAQFGNIAIVKLLLEYGADKQAVDNEYRNASHLAAKWGRKEAVSILETRRAKTRSFCLIKMLSSMVPFKPNTNPIISNYVQSDAMDTLAAYDEAYFESPTGRRENGHEAWKWWTLSR